METADRKAQSQSVSFRSGRGEGAVALTSNAAQLCRGEFDFGSRTRSSESRATHRGACTGGRFILPGTSDYCAGKILPFTFCSLDRLTRVVVVAPQKVSARGWTQDSRDRTACSSNTTRRPLSNASVSLFPRRVMTERHQTTRRPRLHRFSADWSGMTSIHGRRHHERAFTRTGCEHDRRSANAREEPEQGWVRVDRHPYPAQPPPLSHNYHRLAGAETPAD